LDTLDSKGKDTPLATIEQDRCSFEFGSSLTKNERKMIIPYEQLSNDALLGLIEEFITREGTDYGADEVSLSTKVEQIKGLLKRREVVVVFDMTTDSVSILPRRDAEQREQNIAE
jgi:uncharacterized protein